MVVVIIAVVALIDIVFNSGKQNSRSGSGSGSGSSGGSSGGDGDDSHDGAGESGLSP